MPIVPASPIEIPAKTYDKLWVVNVHIRAPGPTSEIGASATLVPYNAEGEILPQRAVEINIENIRQEAENNPNSNAAKAMYFILEFINEKYLASLGE